MGRSLQALDRRGGEAQRYRVASGLLLLPEPCLRSLWA